jgi:hypothetical protein
MFVYTKFLNEYVIGKEKEKGEESPQTFPFLYIQ